MKIRRERGLEGNYDLLFFVLWVPLDEMDSDPGLILSLPIKLRLLPPFRFH